MTAGRTGYDRRIGRYGSTLADALIDAAGVTRGDRALDVGCGSGALTERLAARLGPDAVCGIDPSERDVERCRARAPGADVRVGRGEDLPYPDGAFDAVLSQLVVSFLDDPGAGVAEMRRVARPQAAIATAVWDFGEGMRVLRAFWDAARAVGAPGAAEADQAGTHRFRTRESLDELWRAGGLADVRTGALTAAAEYEDRDDLWDPLVVPDGSPGRFLATLDEDMRRAVRAEVERALDLPDGPFRLEARAWYVVGRNG